MAQFENLPRSVGGPSFWRTKSDSGSASANGSQGSGKQRAGAGHSYQVAWTHQMILATYNVPQRAEFFKVPPGATVRVRAHNGLAGNVGVVYVATDRGSLRGSGRTPLAPLDDVSFTVDNTGRIWAMGGATDGVVISVMSVPAAQ